MDTHKQTQQVALLFATFVIAICGLVYELLAGTLSSYLLGDSVYQFSLVIGLFMSSMGVGAWLSRFIEQELPRQFVRLQLLVGGLGGFTAPLLFFAFAVLDTYTPLLFVLVLLLGSMLGIEIPLIIRILKEHFTLKTNVSNVFTADYIGALLAALLFPLVLVPQLGLLQTGFLIGLLNTVIGLLALYVLREAITKPRYLLASGIGLSLVLLGGMAVSGQFITQMESRLYQDEVIFTQNTPFQQRLVLTKRNERIRFYINGALQFDSFDEYRYHESLVHPVMSVVNNPRQVLVLGGGDGLAVRELLRYEALEHITLVDLDPAVTDLFSSNPLLTQLNQDALHNERVTVVNQDAWKFLENTAQLFDVIILDLPDPNNLSLSRLYSTAFYRLLKQHLAQQGALVTQATSPFYTRKAFWSIAHTLQQTEPSPVGDEAWFATPYHVYIPSFGEWGFVMAARHPLPVEGIQLAVQPLRFLHDAMLPQLFSFAADMAPLEVEANQLSNHPLVRYYEAGWSHWYQ